MFLGLTDQKIVSISQTGLFCFHCMHQNSLPLYFVLWIYCSFHNTSYEATYEHNTKSKFTEILHYHTQLHTFASGVVMGSLLFLVHLNSKGLYTPHNYPIVILLPFFVKCDQNGQNSRPSSSFSSLHTLLIPSDICPNPEDLAYPGDFDLFPLPCQAFHCIFFILL